MLAAVVVIVWAASVTGVAVLLMALLTVAVVCAVPWEIAVVQHVRRAVTS